MIEALFATCLLIPLAADPSAAAPQPRIRPHSPGLRLDGGFIQYQPWMMNLSPEDWRAEMADFRRAGMKTLILQWLASGDASFLAGEGQRDPTRVILEEADRIGMQVFLGLAMDNAWWNRWNDDAFLDKIAGRSAALAREIRHRYGQHASFGGWYVPLETWDQDYTPEEVTRLRRCFRSISDACKRESGERPVAISPFISGKASPEVLGRVYASLLKDSGIDLVLLQDGVGARGWDDNLEEYVIPAFRAMRDACLSAGVELWANVESFRLRPGGTATQPAGFETAEYARLARQLAAEAPFVRRCVTFDLFHYLGPRRGAAQKRLYDAYVRNHVDRPFYPLLGRSVEIDPAFAWYRNRSPASVASEIRAAGYGTVLYVVTRDSRIDRELVDAFHDERIGVWYCTFGNGTYDTADLPPSWESWRMVTRSDLAGTPLRDGYTRICLNNPAYRAWRTRQICTVLSTCPFDGVQIMEPHWPEYPGIESPAYACFCDACRTAFIRMFPGQQRLPDILDANAADSPKRNPDLWRKWLEFRRRTLTEFLDELVNGEEGIRRCAPQAKICTWTLALAGRDGLQRIREDSGEDAADVVRTVRPDLHCLQTHWPDWIRPDLRPNYVKEYAPFVEDIRRVSPALPLMIQADTGSRLENRRSWQWIEDFENASRRLGAGSTTIYEYALGLYAYTDSPRIVEVRCPKPTELVLICTRPVDAAIARDPARLTLTSGRIEGARVDGNCVILSCSGLPPAGQRVELTVTELRVDLARRYYATGEPAVLPHQAIVLPAHLTN